MCLHGSPQPAAHACESRCVVSVESIAQPGAAILHRSRWSLAIPPRRALRRPPPAESPAAVRVAVVGIDLHPTSTLTLAPRLVHIRRGEIAGSGRDVLWRLCPPPPRPCGLDIEPPKRRHEILPTAFKDRIRGQAFLSICTTSAIIRLRRPPAPLLPVLSACSLLRSKRRARTLSTRQCNVGRAVRGHFPAFACISSCNSSKTTSVEC